MRWGYCETMEQVRMWYGNPYLVLSDEEIDEIVQNKITPEIRNEARKFLKRLSEKNDKRLSRPPRVIF